MRRYEVRVEFYATVKLPLPDGEDEAKDAGQFSAHYRCEKCGEQYGNKNAADLAEKLLARICPVTAKRLAGLSAFSGL